LIALIGLLIAGVMGHAQQTAYDFVITGARIVDGTGAPWFIGDIGIVGDRIAAIGDLHNAAAKRRIDATGLVASPGFIGVQGQSEFNVLVDSRAASKITQGVTTEITGEGTSIAPVNNRLLEDMQDGAKKYSVALDWRSLDEYLRRYDRARRAINLGTFVGAGGLREYVMGKDDRPERAKHGRARQCEASEISARPFTGRGHTRSGTTGISGSDSRVLGRCLRDSARGTRGTALAGLRFQQYELQCAAFLLLASGWAPEEHKDGSVCKAIADASESEASLAGVKVAKSLRPAWRFRLPFRKTEGQETARLGFGVEEEDPACLQEDRHHRRGLAHFSAHGRNHAGRDGRTPTDDPRLLASQRSARDQQVSPGNDKKQTLGAREARGCHSAWGCVVGKQIKPNP
jgi:hypothetical protein